MTVRLAVFDCDGTLSDGQAHVCAAMDVAFAAAGLPPPGPRRVRQLIGLSLPQAVARLVPEADLQVQSRAVDEFRQAFRNARESGSLEEPLFEGVADLLGRLHRQGWTLGVATGKSDRGLKSCLVTHGIFDLFVTLQTADRHPSKPDPAMLRQAIAEAGAAAGQTVMIGDTTYDMEMARAVGVRALGVAWGYHRPDELLAAGAEAVAGDPAELGALLDA